MLYSTSFPLRIVTPDKVILEEDVVGVLVPGLDGPFEALAKHAPVAALLEVGQVRVSLGSGGAPTRRYLAISGGVVEVRRDGASLLVDSAEWADVLRDLESLQWVEVKHQQKRFRLRTEARGVCSQVFQAVGVAFPPTVEQRMD